jgi:hypothetical protein
MVTAQHSNLAVSESWQRPLHLCSEATSRFSTSGILVKRSIITFFIPGVSTRPTATSNRIGSAGITVVTTSRPMMAVANRRTRHPITFHWGGPRNALFPPPVSISPRCSCRSDLVHKPTFYFYVALWLLCLSLQNMLMFQLIFLKN